MTGSLKIDAPQSAGGGLNIKYSIDNIQPIGHGENIFSPNW